MSAVDERAALDALRTLIAFATQGAARENAPSPDELLTAKTWPNGSPCSFRAVLDAGKRGELSIVKAGRTPAVRRRDLDAWIASRPVTTRIAPVASEDMGPDLVRARGERKVAGR